MNEVLRTAELVVTASGLLAILLAAPVHGIRPALALGLEFWVGASLLRLSSQPSWSALGAAALVVAIRQLVQLATRRPGPPAATCHVQARGPTGVSS